MKELKISKGNVKMGQIPSISLPPCITCRPDAPCFKECYARRMQRYSNVKNAYNSNLELYNNNPDSYFKQLDAALCINRYFRVHVSGDCPDADYFRRLVTVVASNPGCTVLMFTKRYEFVNEFIRDGGAIPDNFKIVFSNWFGWKCKNPYKFPETEVYNDGDDVPDNWLLCGGNCQNCACRGVGCWQLQRGDVLAFKKH